MARIALLIQETPTLEDGNYLRFARELDKSGHSLDILTIDSLRLLAGQVVADAFSWRSNLKPGSSFPLLTERKIDHDLVWILGLGDRENFLDKYQLLYALPANCKIINSLDAIMHLKSKYFLASQGDQFPSPETYASTSAEELIGIVQGNEGKWIVKPPAGSLGRDVYLTHAGDSQLIEIITNLCGADNNRYTMLQRYIPEIEQGEKRVLLAGGKVIGQYLRRPLGDHRTNITAGAKTEPCSLSDEERTYCTRLARQMLSKGAWFTGVDLVYPWLIEVNVINPGGITTIDELTGYDLSAKVVEAVMANLDQAQVP
jgi:glutathione synthase